MIFRMIGRWVHNRRRKIFRFNDGRRIRSADPVEVAIALAEHAEFLPDHLDDARGGDSVALRIVATAACDVFGVRPLSSDGKSGLTVSERLELMLGFDAYLYALKKNTAPSLIRQPSTASISTDSSEPTTSGTSDCGPTECDPLSENLSKPESESLPPPASPSADGS